MYSIININKILNTIVYTFTRPNRATILIRVLKRLIKYPVTLFTLLLIVYTQVFAHGYRPDAPVKKIDGAEHIQVPTSLKVIGIDGVYYEQEEEEDSRVTLKYFQRNQYAGFIFTCLPGYFFQWQKNHSSSSQHFLTVSFFESPDSEFRVLRL